MPITLAKYRPDAVVQKEDNRRVIRKSVLDEVAAKKAFDEAGCFRGEGYWRFLHPGPILIGAKTKEEFIRAVKK